MTKQLIDVDDQALDTARAHLVTRTIKDTVNEALRIAAEKRQAELGAAGLKGRKVPDLLIAAVAESEPLTVLHYDADFDHIASVAAQPTQWIAPRGSID